MVAAAKTGELDLIIALTEGLVADIAKGSDLRLLGTYVVRATNNQEIQEVSGESSTKRERQRN